MKKRITALVLCSLLLLSLIPQIIFFVSAAEPAQASALTKTASWD